MNAAEKYNNLKGKKISRSKLKQLGNALKRQGYTLQANKIFKSIRENPNIKMFTIDNVEYPIALNNRSFQKKKRKQPGLNGTVIQTTSTLPSSIRSLMIPMDKEDKKPAKFYNIKGDLADFLGKIEIKPIESVGITIDAPQGGMKTRLLFQIMNLFAANKYKCAFISLEEHPSSMVYKSKRNQYIEAKNRKYVNGYGELPEGMHTLNSIIPFYDIIFIDSGGKIPDYKMEKLRKGFNGKLFVVIYQRTQNGKMRGGSDAQYDGDIIMKVEAFPDFRENYAYFNKNRYQEKSLNEVKYYIHEKRLVA